MKYNLESIPREEFEQHQERKNGPIHYYATLEVDFIIDGTVLKVSLTCNKRKLHSGDITLQPSVLER
jgi:hypothetical protein